MKRNITILILLMAGIGAYFYFGLNEVLTFEHLKSKQADLASFYQNNKPQTLAVYFILCVVVSALPLPGAVAMTTVGAGAIFGLFTGALVVSFASSMGATLGFLFSRLFLREIVESKFKKTIDTFNKGMAEDCAFYLFTLRLIPVIPFFIINSVMGLSSLKIFTFYWVSQVGMLATTVIFVNAGTQLASLESLSGILSLKIISSFALLGIFPLIMKKIIEKIKAKPSK